MLLLAHLALGQEPSLYMQAGYTVEYFSQPLDHINGDPGLISIRVIMKQGSASAPLFVYMGGEGPIDDFFELTGWLVYVLGPQFDATVVFIEHRYYGDSLPLTPGYAYLSTDQALLDFASIVMQLKPQEITPVISFGGSYGGMLSAFFRIKFPHLVDGAIASSGPVLEYLDIEGLGLMHVTTQSYYDVMPNCAFNINDAFNIIDNFSQNEYTWSALSASFGLCTPITQVSDVIDLQVWLANGLEAMAQVNYPYPTTASGYLPGNPVEVACSITALFNQNPRNMWMTIRGMSEVANLFYNSTGDTPCFSIFNQVDSLPAWTYQTCSELLMPSGTYGVPNDMFPVSPFEYSSFVTFCNSTFGVTPNVQWYPLNYGFDAYYTHSLRNLTNVVFTYGTIDPWMTGCLKTAPSPNTSVMGINGAAHHLDLRRPNPNDPQSVVLVRQQELQFIQQWISGY